MIYLITLIFILFLVYHYDYRGNDRHKLLYYGILLIMFICITGFRYRLGGDSILYENYFDWSPKISDLTPAYFTTSRFAPGYLIFQAGVRSLTDDFMWFQLIHATIVCSIIFWFFYSNTRKPFVAILLFYIMLYFVMLMEAMRESLAVCMFMIAWPYFRDGKWIKYYICAAIAFNFHISSTFMLLLPLLLLPGIRNMFVFGKRQLMIIPVILILGLMINVMFYKYIELFSLSESITERAQAYSKHESFGGSVLNPFGALSYIIRYLGYGYLAIYFINRRMGLNSSNIWKLDENDKERRELSRLEFLFTVGSYFLVMAIPVFIFNRFNNYFFPITILLISKWVFSILEINGKKIRLSLAYWTLLFFPMIYFQCVGYNQTVNNKDDLRVYMKYYPYASRFDRTIDKRREDIYKYIATMK